MYAKYRMLSLFSEFLVLTLQITTTIQVDCDIEDCELRYIDGSTADSLSVDCAGSGCIGSHIMCPVGVTANCSVDCSSGSCDFAVIENDDGGQMHSLSVHCQSCQYMTISLDPESISMVDIWCESSYSVCLMP